MRALTLCFFRKSLIESSTDTLVGELEGRLLALPLAATAVQYLEPLDSDGLVSQNDEVSVGNSKLVQAMAKDVFHN